MTIDDLRGEIDALDVEIVRLLEARATCVHRIGELKHAQGIAVFQPGREEHVFAQVRAHAAAGVLGPDAVERIYQQIVQEAKQLEHRLAPGGRA